MPEMTDKERYEKQQDILFCLNMLGDQAKRLGLPEVGSLINAAQIATLDVDTLSSDANINDIEGAEKTSGESC